MTPNLPVTHCLGRWWFCKRWDVVKRQNCAWKTPGHESCGPVEVTRVEKEDE